MRRAWTRVLAVAALLVLAVLVFVAPVLALADPANIGIGSAAVFRDVLATGDQLWFMRETVGYASTPTVPASSYFQIAIYTPAGVFTGYSAPLDYWQESIKSIYLTPTQALTITWGDPYLFRVMGMPSVFMLTEGVTMKTQTMSPSGYYEASQLGSYLLAQAQQLQTDWSITLIDAVSGLLNTTGAVYFNKAVPGLYSILPSIFQYSSSYPVLNTTAKSSAGVANYTAHAGSKLSAAINSTAGWLGTTTSWYTIWLTVLVCTLIGSVAYPIVKTPGGALICGSFGLPLCMYIGVLVMNVWLMVFVVVGILFAVIAVQGRVW